MARQAGPLYIGHGRVSYCGWAPVARWNGNASWPVPWYRRKATHMLYSMGSPDLRVQAWWRMRKLKRKLAQLYPDTEAW